MSAECHACALGGIGKLQNPVGGIGDPLAACKICSVFSCGHHGQRDASKPRFVCVQCDPKLLKQSATGGGVDDDADLFKSADEFRERRPRYGSMLDDVSDYEFDTDGPWRDPELAAIAANLAPKSKEMLVLAGVLLKKLFEDNVPLPPDLRDLRDRVRLRTLLR